MGMGWAFVSFVSKGPTPTAVAKPFPLQTGMAVLGAWSSHESRFFYSQIPFHHLVTFLLPKPLFSSLCQVLFDTSASPVAAGKLEGEMEDGFWPLEQGQLVQLWWSKGAGKPCFSWETGLDPLMQDLTPIPPKHQRLLHNLTCKHQPIPRLCPAIALPRLQTLWVQVGIWGGENVWMYFGSRIYVWCIYER